MVALGTYLQLIVQPEGDFSFWLFSMGVPLFSIGLSTLPSKHESAQVSYMCVQATLLLLADKLV